MSQDHDQALRRAARAYHEACEAMNKAFGTPDFAAACAAFQRAEQSLQAAIAADIEEERADAEVG